MNYPGPIVGRGVIDRPIGELVPHERNPRTHSKQQIEQISRSIARFGFTNPVLIDAQGRILAGHGRVAAAKLLDMKTVPTLSIEGMSEADRRAYIIADNRTAEIAGWDDALLPSELAAILELESDYDLTLTGFEDAALDALLTLATNTHADVDSVPEVPAEGPVVSRPGDLWQLGQHRLICGDARDPSVYARLMAGTAAQMIFTDPPYNVPVNGHVSGLGKIRHGEFAMASGEMSEAEFETFLREVLKNLASVSVDGAIHFVCMDWRHMRELLGAGRQAYDELKNLIVWNKDNGGMGSFYRSKHELIFAFKKGKAAHINNFGLGENGRYRTNVWDYAGVNSFRGERDAELAMHPTVKPIALVADAIRDCSKRGEVILDAFSGSGTTIMAAEETSRRGYAIELDPRYVDVAIRRWEKATGGEACLDGSRMTFAEMAALVAE